MTIALRFDNVSKKYHLGYGRANLREFLTRPANRFLGRKSNKAAKEILWALENVSFELSQGKA
jgi:ABC-type polysaccharide/polyol phosphate transport system ATPase subunit